MTVLRDTDIFALTPESYEYCGFEWAGFWFVDTTLPFGWRNSAYVYFTTGEVLSEWLRSRGIHIPHGVVD